jgi:outer membrane protein TolC
MRSLSIKMQLHHALSLTGAFGLPSTDADTFSLADRFLWKSRNANFGPALQWNIFNYGQITSKAASMSGKEPC